MRPWQKRRDKTKLSVDNGCNPFDEAFCNNNPPNILNNGPFPIDGDGDEDFESPLDQKLVEAYQYSFVGPLSMQKGCDNTVHMPTKRINTVRGNPDNNGVGYELTKLSYRGMNDFIFCSWIMHTKKCFRGKSVGSH